MNIAGVLVHARPDRVEEVRAALVELPGVEVHGAAPNGKLVVTIEEPDDASTTDRLTGFYQIDGLIAAAVIYHHFEESIVEEASA